MCFALLNAAKGIGVALIMHLKHVQHVKHVHNMCKKNTYTAELQWLEHRRLVYHGWVEHVLESAVISSKYDIRII